MSIKGKLREGGTEVQMYCPECGKERLFVNLHKRWGYCFWCTATFNPDAVKLLGCEDEAASFFKAAEHYGVSDLKLVSPTKSKEAVAYLEKRGTDIRGLSSEIMFHEESSRLFFRIWSPSGAAYSPSWHTRSIEDGKGWIVYPGTSKINYFFGISGTVHLAERCVPLTICEGIFDALSLRKRGAHAWSILGTKMSMTHAAGIADLVRRGLRQVVCWLDNDAAGIDGREAVCRVLEAMVPVVVEVDGYEEPSESEKLPRECYYEVGT